VFSPPNSTRLFPAIPDIPAHQHQQLSAAQIILLTFLGESYTAKHVQTFNNCCLSSFLVFKTESKEERQAFAEIKQERTSGEFRDSYNKM